MGSLRYYSVMQRLFAKAKVPKGRPDACTRSLSCCAAVWRSVHPASVIAKRACRSFTCSQATLADEECSLHRRATTSVERRGESATRAPGRRVVWYSTSRLDPQPVGSSPHPLRLAKCHLYFRTASSLEGRHQLQESFQVPTRRCIVHRRHFELRRHAASLHSQSCKPR